MNESQLLKIDPVWELYKFPSFAAFQGNVGDLFLRPQVPYAIRRQLSIIHRLLLHSYFEYGFLDIALARALQVFEMTIKTRYAEIEGKPPKRNIVLKKLIDWAGSKGLLEQSLEITQLWRDIRNSVTHGTPETILGVTALQMAQSVVDFVNELYEDIEERDRRHAADREMGRRFSAVVKDGAILKIDGKRLIIFHAEVVCSITEADVVRTYVAYFPIFDAREIEDSMQTPQAIFGECSESEIKDISIRMLNREGTVMVIHPIADDINRARFQAFKSEYDKHPILSMIIHTQVADYRTEIRRAAIRGKS